MSVNEDLDSCPLCGKGVIAYDFIRVDETHSKCLWCGCIIETIYADDE